MTIIQRAFAPIKAVTPRWIWSPVRRVLTAFMTPILFSFRTGHFRSSLRGMAVDPKGIPLPWYTYPTIDFLQARSFSDRAILEFGAGQSTLWWAARARGVVAIDESREWLDAVASKAPGNVVLHFARMDDVATCVSDVESVLSGGGTFDVIIIDGLYRFEMIPIAIRYLAPGGMILCDDAEGYGFAEGLRGKGLMRVDFYGMVPGVVLEHCTSVFFGEDCFAFDASVPIVCKAMPGRIEAVNCPA